MVTTLLACFVQVTIVAIAAIMIALASRRGAVVHATVLAISLVAIGVVSVIAFCPLPNWWLMSAERSDPGDHASFDRQAQSADESSNRIEMATQASPSNSNGKLDIRRLMGFFHAPETENALGSSFWLRLLVVALAVGATLCLLQIVIGLHSIHCCYQRSRTISGVGIDEILENARQAAAISRRIEIRESSEFRVAATVGWLRPVIFLPSDWSEWTHDELVAAVAHEVAHIRRRDFPMRLFAYVINAVHFYHPLVRWLVSRFIRHQEFAADQFAATIVGGRHRYLRALSKMALRQDDRPDVWSASISLPVSSSFLLRRIEMLRAKDCPKRNSVNNFVQWISIATIIAIAIGATSIRSHAQQSEPTQTTTNLDQKSNKSDPKRRQPFYASLIAEKGCAVAVIRIAELLRRPGMQQYRDGFEEEIFASFKSLLKDHPDLVINIEQIELLACTPKVIIDEQDEPKQDRLMFGSDRILIRTIDAFDWRQFLTTLLPNAVEIPHKGRAYFKLPVVPALGPQQLFVHVPDDRTLLLLMGEEATKKLVARPFDSPTEWKWAKQWKALDQGLITFAFDNRNAHWLDERGKEGEWRTIGAALVDEPQFLCVAFDWQAETNRLTFQGQAICERKAQVDKFTGTLASISKLAKDGLINKRPNVKTDVDTKAFAFADSLLKSVNIRVGEAANNRAKIDVRLEAILVSELIQAMVDQGTNEKGS